jgi:hypothetical protein
LPNSRPSRPLTAWGKSPISRFSYSPVLMQRINGTINAATIQWLLRQRVHRIDYQRNSQPVIPVLSTAAIFLVMECGKVSSWHIRAKKRTRRQEGCRPRPTPVRNSISPKDPSPSRPSFRDNSSTPSTRRAASTVSGISSLDRRGQPCKCYRWYSEKRSFRMTIFLNQDTILTFSTTSATLQTRIRANLVKGRPYSHAE